MIKLECTFQSSLTHNFGWKLHLFLDTFEKFKPHIKKKKNRKDSKDFKFLKKDPR